MGRPKQKAKTPADKGHWTLTLVYNMVSVIALFILFRTVLSASDSYQWAWERLLIKNLKDIRSSGKLTIDQKNEIRHGFFYRYLNFINKNTPENAIILMPPDSVINAVDPNYRLGTLKDRRKTTYFIYPRKAVYNKSMEYDSAYLNRITHVAIVNYHGYDHLDYQIDDKQPFSVLPVSRSIKK